MDEAEWQLEDAVGLSIRCWRVRFPSRAPLRARSVIDLRGLLELLRSALIADNGRILSTLDWRPQRDRLDLIVADALAWERKLAERG